MRQKGGSHADFVPRHLVYLLDKNAVKNLAVAASRSPTPPNSDNKPKKFRFSLTILNTTRTIHLR